MSKNLIDSLGIEVLELKEGYCLVEMPISELALQPFGFIHGGINVVLAETAASIGATYKLADDKIAFGMEVNCNHVAAKRSGKLLATALRKHKGKTSEVWTIDITDEDDTLIALARMTMAIKEKR